MKNPPANDNQTTGLIELFLQFSSAYEQASPAEKEAFADFIKENGLPKEIAVMGKRQLSNIYMKAYRAKDAQAEAIIKQMKEARQYPALKNW